MVQRRAIEKYIAKKHHLYGKNDDEEYEIESLNESAIDCIAASPLRDLLRKTPEAEAKTVEFEKGPLKKYLGIWNAHLAKKGSCHLVGDKVTYADLTLFTVFRQHKEIPRLSHMLDEYPELKKFYASIESHPNIAKYLKSPKCYPWPPEENYVQKITSILYS